MMANLEPQQRREASLNDPRSAKDQPATGPNDSGYASQPATGNTTPDKTLDEKLASYQIPYTDSAKPSPINFLSSPFKLKKKTKLTPFPTGAADELSRKAFKTIKPQFDRLLLEHIQQSQRSGDTYTPMSTRLIMMGTSSDNATAHIVVLCHPEQKDAVQRFVKSRVIRDLCEANSAGIAPLKVAALGQAPRLRLAVRVFKDSLRAMPGPQRTTLCGTPIRLRHASGRERKATFGGFVKVLTREGEIRVYGITAGHALQALEGEAQKENVPSGAEGDMEQAFRGIKLGEDENMDDTLGEEDDVGDGSDVELDFCIDQQQVEHIFSDQPWSFETPTAIGSVIHPQPKPSHGDYDWALFETSDYEANKLPIDPKAILTLSQATPGAIGNRTRPIYMVGASSGVKKGVLSTEIGSILLGSSDTFVDTYMVTINDGEPGICDGDSGSWIVDRNTHELYGHLVATDVFDGGYVIPMNRVFDDIQQNLQALAVGLPDNIDILHCRTVAAEVGPPPESQMLNSFNPPSGPSNKKSQPVQLPPQPSSFTSFTPFYMTPSHNYFGMPGSQAYSTQPPYGMPAPQAYGMQPPYGMTPYGMAPYGMAPYGMAPYGMAPYGMTHYSIAPYGTIPYGMAGPSIGRPKHSPQTFSQIPPHPGTQYPIVAPHDAPPQGSTSHPFEPARPPVAPTSTTLYRHDGPLPGNQGKPPPTHTAPADSGYGSSRVSPAYTTPKDSPHGSAGSSRGPSFTRLTR